MVLALSYSNLRDNSSEETRDIFLAMLKIWQYSVCLTHDRVRIRRTGGVLLQLQHGTLPDQILIALSPPV
jgi:hypothetical protein